jgi:hypothetical protein
MLFWLSIFFDLIFTIIICCFITPFSEALIAGIALYTALCIFSTVLLMLSSMFLGKNGPREVREIVRYNVPQYDRRSFYIEDKGTIYGPLPMNFIDTTVVVKDLEQAYVESHRYGISGWRRRWLWELYEDYYIVTLYIPDKDET